MAADRLGDNHLPIHEFLCPNGHVSELFFKTFTQAEGKSETLCGECQAVAVRVLFSRTLEPMFYGNPEGYAKPSATKRYSTKTVSQIEGNKSATG